MKNKECVTACLQKLFTHPHSLANSSNNFVAVTCGLKMFCETEHQSTSLCHMGAGKKQSVSVV